MKKLYSVMGIGMILALLVGACAPQVVEVEVPGEVVTVPEVVTVVVPRNADARNSEVVRPDRVVRAVDPAVEIPVSECADLVRHPDDACDAQEGRREPQESPQTPGRSRHEGSCSRMLHSCGSSEVFPWVPDPDTIPLLG